MPSGANTAPQRRTAARSRRGARTRMRLPRAPGNHCRQATAPRGTRRGRRGRSGWPCRSAWHRPRQAPLTANQAVSARFDRAPEGREGQAHRTGREYAANAETGEVNMPEGGGEVERRDQRQEVPKVASRAGHTLARSHGGAKQRAVLGPTSTWPGRSGCRPRRTGGAARAARRPAAGTCRRRSTCADLRGRNWPGRRRPRGRRVRRGHPGRPLLRRRTDPEGCCRSARAGKCRRPAEWRRRAAMDWRTRDAMVS